MDTKYGVTDANCIHEEEIASVNAELIKQPKTILMYHIMTAVATKSKTCQTLMGKKQTFSTALSGMVKKPD